MAGVERVEFLDNQKSGMKHEQIMKERKIQRDNFEKQVAAGLIKPYVPVAKQPPTTLRESVGLPSYTLAAKNDPVHTISTSISKNMWTSNPGYLERDGPRMTSRFKEDFVYDQDELEYLKSLGYLDKTHNRRRDNFVMYVEAAARSKHLTKSAQ